MVQATFYGADGEEIDIDSDEVVLLTAGDDEETTVVELEDGSEIIVAGNKFEIAAELGLNPLDYVDPTDDDASLLDSGEHEEGDEPDLL